MQATEAGDRGLPGYRGLAKSGWHQDFKLRRTAAKNDRAVQQGNISGPIVSLFLLTSFLPFVSVYFRFSSEIQPWSPLIAWAILAVGLIQKRIRIERLDLILLLFGVLFIIYVPSLDQFSGPTYLRKSTPFLLCASIYIVSRSIAISAARVPMFIALGAYLSFTIIQLLDQSLFVELVANLVPVRDVIVDTRGVASLCPEATDFGFICCYLFWILAIMRRGAAPDKRAGLTVGMIVVFAMLLLTFAGSGYLTAALLGVALAVYYWPRTTLVSSGLLLSLLTFSGPLVETDWNGIRGLSLLSMSITSWPSLVSETTFSYRVVHNVVGLLGFYDSHGFGFGAGTFNVIAPNLFVKYNLGQVLGLSTSYYFQANLLTLRTQVGSVVGGLLLEYGVLGLGYVTTLVIVARRAKGALGLGSLVLLSFAWLQSFPSSYPLFWLLLGLCRNPTSFPQPSRAEAVVH